MRMPKFLLAIILSFMGLGIAQAEDKILMVPHLAIYDLQLENASDKSGLPALSVVWPMNSMALLARAIQPVSGL